MHMHGPTKFFFDDPAQDRLFAMVLSLGAEVAALRDELSAMRSLLDNKGVVSREAWAEYEPSPEAQAEVDRMRETLVANLLFPLQQECETLTDLARSAKD